MRTFVICSPSDSPIISKILEKKRKTMEMIVDFSFSKAITTKSKGAKKIRDYFFPVQTCYNLCIVAFSKDSINDKKLIDMARREFVSSNIASNTMYVKLGQFQLPDELKNIPFIECVENDRLYDISSFETNIDIIVDNYFFGMKEFKPKRESVYLLFKIYLTIITVMIIFIIALQFLESRRIITPAESSLIGGLELLVCLPFLLMPLKTIKNVYQARREEELQHYSQSLKEAFLIDEQESSINVIGQMQINLQNIKEYYLWSQKQARGAYSFAIIMSIFGFLLFVTAIVLASIQSVDVYAAVISTICGGVSELIAGTVMVIYRSSVKQLKHYHQALHEDQRFLSCIRLLDKIKEQDIYNDMLSKVLSDEMQIGLINANKNEWSKEKAD